jgi:hypothetical protein
MIVYVCYFDYGEWDFCSHPIAVFHNKNDALDWVERNGKTGRIREMIMAKEYIPR